MRNLFLHIGIPKTGTTSIQSFLNENQDLLDKQNLYFCKDFIINQSNCISLPYLFTSDDSFKWFENLNDCYSEQEREKLRTKIEDVFEEKLKKHKNMDWIISSEHIFNMSQSEESIENLFNYLSSKFSKIKIIVYIRNQVDYYLSSFSTQIRGRYLDSEDVFMPILKEGLANPKGCEDLYYDISLNNFAKYFGEGNIVVDEFVIDKKNKNSIFESFLGHINIKNKKSFIYNQESNTSRTLKELDSMIYLRSKLDPEFDIRKFKAHNLKTILEKYFKKNIKKNDKIKVDINTAKLWNDEFKDSNSKILKKYFPEKKEIFPINKSKLISTSLFKKQLKVSLSNAEKKRINEIANLLNYMNTNGSIETPHDFSKINIEEFEDYLQISMNKTKNNSKKLNSKKPKGLWLTNVQLEPSRHGNTIYLKNILSRLSDYADMEVLYFVNKKIYQDNKAPEIKGISKIHYIEKTPNLMGNLLSKDGLNSHYNFINKELINWIKGNVNKNKYDFVACDYPFLAPIFDFIPEKIVKIINTHDVYGDRHDKLEWDDDLKKKAFCMSSSDENLLLSRSDLLITISNHEKNIFLNRLSSYKKGVDATCIRFLPKSNISNKKISKPKDCVKFGFIGSDNPVNVAGVLAFIESTKKLKKINFKFVVAGLVCNRIEDDLPFIEKLYEVDEDGLKSFYKNIDLIVNPMPENTTGLKIKTIESIINDIPIVGTFDAFTGLDSNSIYHNAKSIDDLVVLIEDITKNEQMINEVYEDCSNLKKEYLNNSRTEIYELVNTIREKIFLKNIIQPSIDVMQSKDFSIFLNMQVAELSNLSNSKIRTIIQKNNEFMSRNQKLRAFVKEKTDQADKARQYSQKLLQALEAKNLDLKKSQAYNSHLQKEIETKIAELRKIKKDKS